MLLEVTDLEVRYGRTRAVSQLSMCVDEGEIVTVLGANGAGKSSLLKALQGLVRPRRGNILFTGRSIIRSRVDERIRSGLVLVPEGRQILVSLTVHENLLLGAYTRGLAGIDREIDDIYQRFPNLASRRHMAAACLSGGEQQMLAIGRALIARPRLLMLDEPSLGLSPLLIDRLFELITALNRAGLSILVVEQNTAKALAVANRGYVLELGKLVLSGAAADLTNDDNLRAAYLGEAAAP
jgi:branched-chain amino acid transport system ATP-binding protein